MKIRRPSASLFAHSLGLFVVLLAGLVSSAAAYGQAMDGIRVVDIKYLLDTHPRYQAAKTAITREYEATSKRFADEKEAIIRLHDQLKVYAEGSADYRRLDDDINHRQAEWALQRDRQNKDFRSREAEIVSNVYLEILMAIRVYCERNNVGMVIQFNSQPPDARKPIEVISSINHQIVYVAPNRDISQAIHEMIIRGDVPVARDPGQNLPPPGVQR